ncbi:hypothetical protein IEO21_07857 [Rhodonia placenta]|uniref:Uncharacterized protein n=1 Tax=Rhodonia placenta TaxID=104341 RepID=A0A8H7TZX2_9APHY|nr:hypothetical protein IEO21_07857 [Postia placenta]
MSLLTRAGPRGQERARKLGRASNQGPEAPIVVYNDRARSRGQTRSSRRRTVVPTVLVSDVGKPGPDVIPGNMEKSQ